MNNLDKALEDFDRAIALDEILIISLCNDRGLVLNELGWYAEAITSFERGLHENLNRYRLLYNIAVTVACWKGHLNVQTYIETARYALLASWVLTYVALQFMG